MSRSNVRLLSAYLFAFASALSVGAVVAGPPTPLVPAQPQPTQTGPVPTQQQQQPSSSLPPLPAVNVPATPAPSHRVEPPPPAGNVYVPQSTEPAAPATTEDSSFAQRAGRTVETTIEATGNFFDHAAQAAGDLFDKGAEATGNAWDWMLRESGDLMKRSGETLQRWSE